MSKEIADKLKARNIEDQLLREFVSTGQYNQAYIRADEVITTMSTKIRFLHEELMPQLKSIVVLNAESSTD